MEERWTEREQTGKVNYAKAAHFSNEFILIRSRAHTHNSERIFGVKHIKGRLIEFNSVCHYQSLKSIVVF